MSNVEIRNLTKSYGGLEVVHGINLQIDDGEFVVLVGPSGCGKSTVLRMLCGLEDISGGEVEIGGKVVNDLAPKDRNIAMVFQDYALYPHMTVRENIEFGLKMRKKPAAQRREAVEKAAQVLQIDHLLDRKPKALSGGQRQRVAMGRAIVRDADVFLYDEPLSNLDAKLRIEMRAQIRKLHEKVGTTSIFVTHDQAEAMTLADRIVCLKDGHIAQVGTPDDLYFRPNDLFVATFIGSPTINLIEGHVDETGRCLKITNAGQETYNLEIPGSHGLAADSKMVIGLRPEDIFLTEFTAKDVLAGTVGFGEKMGSDTFVNVDLMGQELVVRCKPSDAPRRGERVRIDFDRSRLLMFDASNGKSLAEL